MRVRLRQRFADRLGFRITFLIALALLPLAMLSAAQTMSLAREAWSRSESALLGDSVRVGANVLRRIQVAHGAASALASTLGSEGATADACARLLSAYTAVHGNYSFVAFVPPSGVITCTGSGKDRDVSAYPAFRDLFAKPRSTFAVLRKFPGSKTPVLGVIEPVISPTKGFLGFISLGIPQKALEDAPNGVGKPAALTFATMFFDGNGELLTSSVGANSAQPLMPKSRSIADLPKDNSTAFTTTARGGDKRTYAFVPVVQGKLYLLATWPAVSSDTGLWSRLPPMVLPALMAIVSLIVAWMAAEHLALRHIRGLHRAIRDFAGGSRIVGPAAPRSAPLEIREVIQTFSRMTETIMRDEAELEDAVHQKEVLLREVHHRIKNNLQIIASMMNMQLRHEKMPEVRAIMKTLNDRVMSLATIHRGLYQTSGVSDVRADELLSSIVHQVLSIGTGPGRKFNVNTDFDDIHLTPDQAVPLSLLLTEALANALKYADAPQGLPVLNVSLRRSDGTGAVLVVENSVAPAGSHEGHDIPEGTGIGERLQKAFAQQLGGVLESGRVGSMFRLSVGFSVIPLSDAEERGKQSDPD